jgi:hypothetical protein
MDPLPRPLAFFLLLVSGWVNRQHQAIIDYLLPRGRVVPGPSFRTRRGLVIATPILGGLHHEYVLKVWSSRNVADHTPLRHEKRASTVTMSPVGDV